MEANVRSTRLAAWAMAAGLAVGTALAERVVYNNIPDTLDPNYPSQPYEAQRVAEFGDRITFGIGAPLLLQSVTFTMSDWAKYEDWQSGGWAGPGFYHDFTLNLYEAGTGADHGALVASTTQNLFVPYRPTGWSKGGYAFNLNFDLSTANIAAPDSIVYGLAFNTNTAGYDPVGVSGPYDSLNFGCNTAPGGGITIGSTDVDEVFISYNGGVFANETGWTGYVPMARFTVPEPATAALIGLGGLVFLRRRRA